MAKAIDKIQLVLDLKGFSQISGLGKDFEKLKSTVKIADKDVDEFVNTLRQVRKETKLSKNAFQGQIDALKRTKDNVAIGSNATGFTGVKTVDVWHLNADITNAHQNLVSVFASINSYDSLRDETELGEAKRKKVADDLESSVGDLKGSFFDKAFGGSDD